MRFACGGLVWLGHPPHYPILLYINLFSLSVALFLLLHVAPKLPRPWLHGVLTFVLIFVLLAFSILTWATDPGVLPPSDLSPQEGASLAQELNRRDAIPEKIRFGSHRYCATCKTVRPPYASHCGVCNQCVREFDHHCLFVANCIGARNHHYFFWLVTFYFIGGIYWIGCLFLRLVLALKAQQFSYLNSLWGLSSSFRLKFFAGILATLAVTLLCNKLSLGIHLSLVAILWTATKMHLGAVLWEQAGVLLMLALAYGHWLVSAQQIGPLLWTVSRGQTLKSAHEGGRGRPRAWWVQLRQFLGKQR